MVKLSDAGKIRAEKYRLQAGFSNKKKLYIVEVAPNGLSEGTVKRFWNQEDISVDSFIAICQAINIEDWNILVDWGDDVKKWEEAKFKDKLTTSHTKGVGTLAVKIINDHQFILASGSYDSTINIWQINPDNFKCLTTLTEHEEDVSSLIFTENHLISGSYDKTIKIWETTLWECIDTLKDDHDGKIECLALTSDDQYLWVSYCDSVEICLWDFKKKKLLYKLPGHSTGRLQPSKIASAVLGLLLTPDNTVISSGIDGKLISWQILNEENTKNVNPIFTLINDENSLKLKAITSLAISPDGQSLAVGENSKQITIWDIAKKSLVYSTTGKHDFPNILALAYHPTGQILASASFYNENPLIRVWNPNNGDIITTLTVTDNRHSSPIRSLIFSPNGTMLIAGDEAGHIFLWGV